MIPNWLTHPISSPHGRRSAAIKSRGVSEAPIPSMIKTSNKTSIVCSNSVTSAQILLQDLSDQALRKLFPVRDALRDLIGGQVLPAVGQDLGCG